MKPKSWKGTGSSLEFGQIESEILESTQTESSLIVGSQAEKFNGSLACEAWDRLIKRQETTSNNGKLVPCRQRKHYEQKIQNKQVYECHHHPNIHRA